MPAYKDGKPIEIHNMRDYDLLAPPEERNYKVPKVTYPRLDLNIKQDAKKA